MKILARIGLSSYLCIAFRKQGLSHGVMVALQFLVLSVEVRILVRQLTEGRSSVVGWMTFLFRGLREPI